jgi:hypothetical protein
MKTKIKVILMLGGAILTASGVAWAKSRNGIHGNVCKGKTSADAQYVRYDQYGIHNASTSKDIYVECELGYAPPTSTVVKNLRSSLWSVRPSGVYCDVEYRDAFGNTSATYPGSVRSTEHFGHAETMIGAGYGSGEWFGYAHCFLGRADVTYGANYLSSITWELD